MKTKTSNEPHAQRGNDEHLSKNISFYRRGWLKNGNPPGDPTKAPRCNAHSKRTGNPCQQPAMTNGKCRLHGGKSTGPRTPDGLACSRRTNWKHGEYSAEAKSVRAKLREEFKLYMDVLKQVKEAT